MNENDPDAAAPEPSTRPPASLFDPAPQPPLIEHAEPPPPEPVVMRKTRGGTPLPLTLLLIAALGGAGYWAWSHPKPDTQSAIEGVRGQLAQQLQAITTRVDTLEKQPQGASPDASAELAKKLEDLAGKVTALGARQDQMAAQADKAAELLAQKNAAPPESAPPPDNTAQQVPALTAGQQAADTGHNGAGQSLDDKLNAEKTAFDQAQSEQRDALATLTQRLAKLEQIAAQPAPAPDDTAQKAAATASAAVGVLNARVAKLEQGAGQTAGAVRDASLAVRITAAEAALSAGQPLGDLPGAPPALARFATQSPPTEDALRAAFPDMAEHARAISQPVVENRSFLDRLLARAQQSLVVRRGDHVIVGDPAAGILSHAQDQVTAGDLKGAAETLGALQGPAAGAVENWVGQARALLDARAALATLAAHS